MTTKLTLKLDKEVIEKAKSYAKAKQTDLSTMVENYFNSLTGKNSDDEFSPIVQELSGIIEIPEDLDLKEELFLRKHRNQ